jgi:hypothetical protein
MSDDALERLLRGYQLTEPSRALDQRVFAQTERILARGRMREAVAEGAREFANAFGFGYVSYVIDLITATDAEYRVDLI